VISKLRKGATPDEATAATAVFGKSNFEKRADLSQANALFNNLKRVSCLSSFWPIVAHPPHRAVALKGVPSRRRRARAALALAPPSITRFSFVARPPSPLCRAPCLRQPPPLCKKKSQPLDYQKQQYAKPTDTGARGAVAARIHSKLAKNYDGDTEDGVNFIQQSAQKSVRLTLARSDLEQKKSG
jgi:hypothetical protein